MITIDNHDLIIGGNVVEELPHLPVDATVSVWSVPTEYRDNGFFVGVQRAGTPPVIPACNSHSAVFLGSAPLPADPDAITAEQVAQAREQAHARINAEYATRTAQLAAGYPPTEQQSWPIQIQEAKIVLSGDTETPTPWIDAAAATREVTRTELATLISNQDTAYRQYHGTLTGVRQKLRDYIESLPVEMTTLGILNNLAWPE